MKIVRYGPGHTPIDTSGYPGYLAQVKDRLPPGARAYAEAIWHYDFQDQRCPHDAWMDSLIITEIPDRDHPRRVDLFLRLVGANHSGYLEFRYTSVTRYASTVTLGSRGHGDLMIDEITLEDDNQITHEIAFERGNWEITCRDLSVIWIEAEGEVTSTPPQVADGI